MPKWFLFFVSALVSLCSVPAAEPSLPPGFKLLYEESFEQPNPFQQFNFTDPAAWKLGEGKTGKALELFGESHYTPPFRSPFNIALLKEKKFADFALEADLLQTGREYGHRDLCLIFGFQSPTNYYYAHIASAADEHAHNIFIVNGAPRIKIATSTTKGIEWGDAVWHKVRLERTGSTGETRIFFDDMKKPIMTASDKTFASGHVGFGSFDDTGKFDNIRIWGNSVENRPAAPFRKSP